MGMPGMGGEKFFAPLAVADFPDDAWQLQQLRIFDLVTTRSFL